MPPRIHGPLALARSTLAGGRRQAGAALVCHSLQLTPQCRWQQGRLQAAQGPARKWGLIARPALVTRLRVAGSVPHPGDIPAEDSQTGARERRNAFSWRYSRLLAAGRSPSDQKEAPAAPPTPPLHSPRSQQGWCCSEPPTRVCTRPGGSTGSALPWKELSTGTFP